MVHRAPSVEATSHLVACYSATRYSVRLTCGCEKLERKMAELIIARFDVDELTAPALNVMKAAVTHAETHRGTRSHTVSLDVFCRLAGLPNLCGEECFTILQEACRALVIVEAVDTLSPDRDDLPYASWPVFGKIWVDNSNVSFKVSNHIFHEGLLASLPTLTTPERAPSRKRHLINLRVNRSSSMPNRLKECPTRA